jgi:hypothetical protein
MPDEVMFGVELESGNNVFRCVLLPAAVASAAGRPFAALELNKVSS